MQQRHSRETAETAYEPAVLGGGGGSKIYISPTLFRLKPMWVGRFNLSKSPPISTNTLLGRQRNM